ncbi:interferon regulatory factor 2-like isoform X2 [Denticeps clupeoides]|nr:interferon regulatory factor 2-like isoform X2 [Denticeps clupeoides]
MSLYVTNSNVFLRARLGYKQATWQNTTIAAEQEASCFGGPIQSGVAMPVERMRMRPWLEEQIEGGLIPGLVWLDKESKIFQIPWIHAARHGWDLDKDAPLFMNWAIHTGKYHPGVDRPDPKTWKANFRCAMNSLPDIEEVKDKSTKKGTNAFKVYRILSPVERAIKKGKKKMEKALGPKSDRTHGRKYSQSRAAKVKIMQEADSTQGLEHDLVIWNSTNNQLVISELLDVCHVVEVNSENEVIMQKEGPSVTSCTTNSQHFSPVSSSEKIETESIGSDEDSSEGHAMDLQWSSTEAHSVLKFPSCNSASTTTFFTSGKANFKVTTHQEKSPVFAYDSLPWWQECLHSRFMSDRVNTKSPAHPRLSTATHQTVNLRSQTSVAVNVITKDQIARLPT